MDKQLFDDLVESLKQAKAISKDDAKASRRFKVGTIKGAKVDPCAHSPASPHARRKASDCAGVQYP